MEISKPSWRTTLKISIWVQAVLLIPTLSLGPGCHSKRDEDLRPSARASIGQDSLKRDGPFKDCFQHVLPEVRSAKSIGFSDTGRENVVIGEDYLLFKQGNATLAGPTVAGWLAVVDHEKIRLYRTDAQETAFFLLSSPIAGSTGLATNITKWLVANLDRRVAYEFSSLSSNPEFFYFRSDSGKLTLNCIVFDYTDEFLNSEDRSTLAPAVKAVHMRWAREKETVVREWLVRCVGG
jgi:hypothetical protein